MAGLCGWGRGTLLIAGSVLLVGAGEGLEWGFVRRMVFRGWLLAGGGGG